MHIGVIGLGVVGSAVAHGLERAGNRVSGHDLSRGTTIDTLRDTEVAFICVPTPPTTDGQCDVRAVRSVLSELAELGYQGVATIKSTVIPGTTDALAREFPTLTLAFCPEFLRERAAFSDFFENHDVCVIGAYTDEAFDAVRRAHGTIPKNVCQVRPLEAEFVKYFSNVFNALRITFANEFYEVCNAVGADYAAIKACAVKRSNIPDYYLDCNDQFRGFGGVCLPKDTRAFAAFARAQGLSHLHLFDTIVEDNDHFVRTVPEGMRP